MVEETMVDTRRLMKAKRERLHPQADRRMPFSAQAIFAI